MTRAVDNFNGMTLVKAEYTSSEKSDTEFAAYATEKLGKPYSLAQIRAYRGMLKIPNNGSAPSDTDMRLEEAIVLLTECFPHVPLDLSTRITEFLNDEKE